MAYSKSSVLCTATIVICLLNLLGWLLDIAFLKAPISGTPAMSAATVILLVLSAFSLLILYISDRFKKANILLARLLALTVASVSVLLLVRYLQIGKIMFANGQIPPSPQTLLFTLFAGLYLFFISQESRKYFWVVNALQAMSFMVLWVVTFGYLLEIDRLYDYVQGGPIGMGIFTLISGFMLWFSTTRLRPDLDVVMKVLRQQGAAGSITRQLFLISALAPCLWGRYCMH